MGMHRCLQCGKPCAYPPDQQQDPRLYTPTMEGFERFNREMVGVHMGAPEGGPDRTVRAQNRRKKR